MSNECEREALAQVALEKIRKAMDSDDVDGWVEFGHRVEQTLHEYDWSVDSGESVPCPECGEPRPFGLDFLCLDCNGVRYVREDDWYAHHGCGFEEEWKYQCEAREAIDKHRASCDWTPEPQAEPNGKPGWPDHWTVNDKLRDLHARWHDQPGNLIGREACGWDGCEFWDAAQFTLRMAEVRVIGGEQRPEPTDAAARALAIHDAWGTPDDPEGKIRPMSDYTNLSARMAQELRKGADNV